MALEDSKKAFLAAIDRDRNANWYTFVPQIVCIGVAALVIGGIAVFGLLTAIHAFRDNPNAETLQKAASVFLGTGSTGVLGFVAYLLTKMWERSKEYAAERRRFTGVKARVQLATTNADYIDAIKEYERR